MAKAVRGRTIIPASYTIGYACGLSDTRLVAFVYVDHSGFVLVPYRKLATRIYISATRAYRVTIT